MSHADTPGVTRVPGDPSQAAGDHRGQQNERVLTPGCDCGADARAIRITPRSDDRIQQMITDPESYFRQARAKRLEDARAEREAELAARLQQWREGQRARRRQILARITRWFTR